MEMGIIFVCLILIVAVAIACTMLHSLLKSAISLAAISALLSIILFVSGAVWAAMFELSVCAGLVTVVFVSAISMTKSNRHSPESVAEHHKRFSVLPFLLIFSGMALVAVLSISGFSIQSTADPTAAMVGFKETFWNMRQADILGQIIIILAGAFAVVILFKERDKA